MCDFGEAERALQAAHAMQLTMFASLGGLSLGIRVGCHYGPVLDNAGDIYGDSVNVAARIVGLAKTGQVIVTPRSGRSPERWHAPERAAAR